MGLLLQFGKGFMKPELRILKVGGIGDPQELAWCKRRWSELEGEMDDADEDGEEQSEKRQLKGPTSVEHHALKGREYIGVDEWGSVSIRWWILDPPLDGRVIEFYRSAADSDSFFREAKKILAAAQSARTQSC